MNSKKYLEWAITKDRNDEQYIELGVRLHNQRSQQRILHAAMGIAGESGELMDAVKKHIMYNKPLDVENIKEELGDLLWYMSLALDQIGSSFEEVMKMNHDKLEKRYPGGFTEKLAQERLDKISESEQKDPALELLRSYLMAKNLKLEDDLSITDRQGITVATFKLRTLKRDGIEFSFKSNYGSSSGSDEINILVDPSEITRKFK